MHISDKSDSINLRKTAFPKDPVPPVIRRRRFVNIDLLQEKRYTIIQTTTLIFTPSFANAQAALPLLWAVRLQSME
jgi:hypothetical protein